MGGAASPTAGQDPEEHLRAGRRWLDAGNAEAAAASFRLMVAAQPDSRSWYYLGVAYLQGGRPEEAVAALRRAEALGQRPNRALEQSLGTALLRVGDAEGAAVVLARAAERHPRAPDLLLQLGHAHYRRLDADAARSVLRRARGAAPGDPRTHFHLGLAESALGDLPAAEGSFREAARLASEDPEARVALGRTLAQQGRAGEARAAYGEALRLAPGSAAALTALGMLDLAAGEAGRAARRFEEALASEPEHRQALYNLGAALRLLGRPAEAEAVERRFAATEAAQFPSGSRSRSRSGTPRRR